MACPDDCDASVMSMYTTETTFASPNNELPKTTTTTTSSSALPPTPLPLPPPKGGAKAAFLAVMAAQRIPAIRKNFQQPDDDDSVQPMKPKREIRVPAREQPASLVARQKPAPDDDVSVGVVQSSAKRPVSPGSTDQPVVPQRSHLMPKHYPSPNMGPPRGENRYKSPTTRPTVNYPSVVRPLPVAPLYSTTARLTHAQDPLATPRQSNTSRKKAIETALLYPPRKTMMTSTKTFGSADTPVWSNTSKPAPPDASPTSTVSSLWEGAPPPPPVLLDTSDHSHVRSRVHPLS